MNLPITAELLLAGCLFLGAMLYTSVGHAGASAYIAAMALFGVAPTVMRPTALVLNILVSGLTTFRYMRADLFRWIVCVKFCKAGRPSRLAKRLRAEWFSCAPSGPPC